MSLKSKLTKTVIALVMAGASSYTIVEQFLTEKEGMRYTAYQDGGGVWTICLGHTKGVKKGDTATPAQCAEWARQDIGPAIKRVEQVSPVPLSEPAKAGIASFCFYNLGETKCRWTRDSWTGQRRETQFWAAWMRGDMETACNKITDWVFDGGRDCRKTQGQKNGCYGQVIRREQERELCLIGR